MLKTLVLQNYILLSNTEIDFSVNFNLLSGETGAGKSILLTAIAALLGKKVTTDIIAKGEEEAIISAICIILPNTLAAHWLKKKGFQHDGEISLRRIIKHQGRNSVYLQGQAITIVELEEFSSLLFDLHSQHENQSLFSTLNQRRLMDNYLELNEDIAVYQGYYKRVKALRDEEQVLQEAQAEQLREKELLEFAIEEIQQLELEVGEDAVLRQKIIRLSQHEKITAYLTEIDQEGQTLIHAMKNITLAFPKLSDIDASFASLDERTTSLFYELEDIQQQVRAHLIDTPENNDELETLLARESKIQSLKKKYGNSINEILDYAEQSSQTLATLEQSGERLANITAEMKEQEQAMIDCAEVISQKRKAGSTQIVAQITATLQDLGMKYAQFQVTVSDLQRKNDVAYGLSGKDEVEFWLLPHSGTNLKKLKEIASGGEIARVMLAIKSLLAQSDSMQTLIFDEIDTGIGGEVAVAVGKYIRQLAQYKQVICITHLASIASFADHHLLVKKTSDTEHTQTTITSLDATERVNEIARMLSGNTDAVSVQHAQSLLAQNKIDS